MTRHHWELEEVDSGHLGVNSFWTCKACGASGGGEQFDMRESPFLARARITLSTDCDEAKKQIAEYTGQREAEVERAKDITARVEYLERAVEALLRLHTADVRDELVALLRELEDAGAKRAAPSKTP